MEKRTSFILHFDSLEVLNELSKEQIADLFIAIRDYNLWKEINLSWLMKAVFVPFKNQFDRDLKKYNEKCEVNAENIKKRWNKKDTKNTSGINGKKNNTKDTYNDNDNKNDNDNDNDNNKEKRNTETYIWATRSEVIEELNKIIVYWNDIWKEKRKVTLNLEEAYLKARRDYSKEDIKQALSLYIKEKKDTERQYRLDPLRFFTQKNWFITYL